jgi:two-component system, chemotaxis family, sensor kinase CheA
MDDNEIITEFVVESREHLADIEGQFLAIEAAGAEIDVELVNTVFRAVHSIKGAAGFLGFSTVAMLAHDLENILNLIRNKEMVPDGVAIDVLLRAADKLRSMIENIDHSNEVDISEHIEALQHIVSGLLAEEISGPALPPAVIDVMDPADNTERFEVEQISEESLAQSAPATPQPTATFPEPEETKMAESNEITTEAPALPKPAEKKSVPQAAAQAASGASTASVGESNIRVAVTVLDRLMNLAGELVLSRNQLLQTVAAADQDVLGIVAARVNQVTSELQETIMQTRLQTIGTVFGKFQRVVRDLSNSLGKQCQLTIEGQEVELDKSIIESIGDPLTHLVRNAVDHGIELPDVRAKAGKPPVGTLALRAFHQAGKVNIHISDDGRGIDVAKLKEKAVAKGIVTSEQARGMSDREALQLIFRPGFSMAAQVTEVSGRGVGMDVVKTNIERLGGTVTVDTELGIGTQIHVKLPLTLAIIPSLVVRSAGRRYAIPQASIRELVRVKAADAAKRIERVKFAEVFRLRGTLLPLIRLTTALKLDEDQKENAAERAMHIIVVESGHLRYGLVVDSLCDSEEIVVKPLGRHMKNSTCLAGATILGDGKVALILDIAGIATHCQLTIPEGDSTTTSASGDLTHEMQALLLFSNHPAEYFGIAMESVARIERVRSDQIDSVGGQQILQYRGGTLPLLSLENYIGCKCREETDKVYVVVFAAARREVGLLVPKLLDIRNVPTQIDTATFLQPGVIGSFVFEQMTVRLVDLHEVTRLAHGDWFTEEPVQNLDDGSAPRILVAEDSDFFRKQLMNFFQTEGYEVVGCEDGAIAWNVIQKPEERFDLVVTDIEMPNMSGLELSQTIRHDPRFADIPIIAVTSLAGEEDVQRGREIGIDEYHVKLDREQLMASVARLLKKSTLNSNSRSIS